MINQELAPQTPIEVSPSRSDSPLMRLSKRKNKLASTYRDAAGELQARAEALEAEHAAFEARVAETDESLETAIAVRQEAETAEHEAFEALQVATEIYSRATAAKQAYGQKGNEPFALITDAEITIPEEINSIIDLHIKQLEALLAQARGGKESPLHIFLEQYLLAKKEYEEKKKQHDEASRKLVLARQDEDHFRAEKESLDSEADQRGILVNRAQKRADTGQKHIKGERQHQVIADNVRGALGAMGIMGAMRTGNFRSLETVTVIQGEVEA